MPKASVNGTTLNYVIDGPEDAPWLTFSDSLACNLSMWDGQVAELAGPFRTLRYDKRGHGESDGPAGDYSFPELARDVVALWDHLGIKESDFCGLSMGGMTGIGLLLDHADRIGKAAICDCRADAPPMFHDMWIERRGAYEAGGIEAMVDGNLERWFTEACRQENPPWLEDVRAMIRTTSSNGFMGCTAALMNLDYLKRMDAITGDVMFLVGAQDGPHPDAMAEMQSKVAGSSLVVVENAAHLPNLEQPEAFNAALKSYFGV
jgi:3-oxoadipate enol-lactonase